MRIEGIGAKRRAGIEQICRLVGEVDEFSVEDFNRMKSDFRDEDQTMHSILEAAVETADANYTRFLNAKIAGVPYRFAHLDKGFCSIEDDESVLGKAMTELRARLTDEKEYRSEFLAPAINQAADHFDQKLSKVQSQEIERRREEERARSRALRSRSLEIEF